MQGPCMCVLKLLGNHLREKVPHPHPITGALVAVPMWPCIKHCVSEERFWVGLRDGQIHHGVLVLEPVNPDPGLPRHHVESQCWPKLLSLLAASNSYQVTECTRFTEHCPNRHHHHQHMTSLSTFLVPQHVWSVDECRSGNCCWSAMHWSVHTTGYNDGRHSM